MIHAATVAVSSVSLRVRGIPSRQRCGERHSCANEVTHFPWLDAIIIRVEAALTLARTRSAGSKGDPRTYLVHVQCACGHSVSLRVAVAVRSGARRDNWYALHHVAKLVGVHDRLQVPDQR